jgi:tetratricopeptide (TPR) repeat protein
MNALIERSCHAFRGGFASPPICTRDGHSRSAALRVGALCLLLLCAPPTKANAHGDLHMQIDELTERLQKDADDGPLYHARGELYRAHGDYRAALRDYDRAARLAPSLSVVQLSRGRALLESGQFHEAERALTRFLEAEPSHGAARLLRARARSKLARHASADVDYQTALDISSDTTPDLYLERADNLARAGMAAEALRVLEAGTTQLGKLVTLESAALELELQLGLYSAALSRVDAMLAEAPRRETLLARKADILDAAGRAAEARKVRLESLLELERLPANKRKLRHTKQLEQQLRAALDAEVDTAEPTRK